MRLQSVHIGDLVHADVKGRRFYAEVTGREDRTLVVQPITHNITYTRVKAREVIAHYRRSRNGNGATK